MSAITTFPRTTSRPAAPSRTAPTATAPTATAPNGTGSTHLHITRRGRAVLTLITIAATAAFMFAFVLGGGSASATNTAGSVSFEHVTVASGETLWQVAVGVAPNSDPRDVVTDIMRLNNLQGTDILPGQSLAIPTKYSE